MKIAYSQQKNNIFNNNFIKIEGILNKTIVNFIFESTINNG